MDDSAMIVVHATSTHDARVATKRGIDEATRYARSKGIPVAYLQDDTPQQFYFMEDCNPDYWVRSEGGEIHFDVSPAHIYIAGGHLEMCMSTALHEILYQWARKPKRNLTVTYLMDAIYSNGRMMDTSEPFYGEFARFINVVTHGRPAGEHWPKLTLLETLGIIMREEQQNWYLSQILPRWDRIFPESYQVELQLNDSPKRVLRASPDKHPPTLLFHFVDPAVNLSTTPFQRGY